MSDARGYQSLDAVVVIGSMVMVSGLGYGLVFVEIPQEQLPIVASLVTAILSLPVAYGAFRWGNNVGAKLAQEAAAESTKAANGALAQIAGAGPPPPAAPLDPSPPQEVPA
jgi:hypothetical protein